MALYRQLSDEYANDNLGTVEGVSQAKKSKAEADMKTSQLEASLLSNERSLVILQNLDLNDDALYELMED